MTHSVKRHVLMLVLAFSMIWAPLFATEQTPQESYEELLKKGSDFIRRLSMIEKLKEPAELAMVDVGELSATAAKLHASLKSSEQAYANGYDIAFLSKTISRINNFRMALLRTKNPELTELGVVAGEAILSLRKNLESERIENYEPQPTSRISYFSGTNDAKLEQSMRDAQKANVTNTRQKLLASFNNAFSRMRLAD